MVANVGLTLDDIDWIIPHQANIRIIDFAARRLGFPIEKIAVNIDHTGNTSSASIPIMADELWRAAGSNAGRPLFSPLSAVDWPVLPA